VYFVVTTKHTKDTKTLSNKAAIFHNPTAIITISVIAIYIIAAILEITVTIIPIVAALYSNETPTFAIVATKFNITVALFDR